MAGRVPTDLRAFRDLRERRTKRDAEARNGANRPTPDTGGTSWYHLWQNLYFAANVYSMQNYTHQTDEHNHANEHRY
jgi:hypothetical protein